MILTAIGLRFALCKNGNSETLPVKTLLHNFHTEQLHINPILKQTAKIKAFHFNTLFHITCTNTHVLDL